jgi:L,D-peptidoglycan transpeptidase YkuD (ErfK/YbiS/YcfS/YnhG family)
MPIGILEVSRLPGRPRQGLIVAGALVLRCALGRSGIVRDKREGDGGTPAGTLRPLAVFYRPDRERRPATELPLHAVAEGDGWCDDPGDRNYNRLVGLPYPAGHERLWRDDSLYDLLVVLDWNMAPVIRQRGSAIFLHLARDGYAPTEGCIALSRHDMGRLLPELDRGTEIIVR